MGHGVQGVRGQDGQLNGHHANSNLFPTTQTRRVNMEMQCDRCNETTKYKEDYLFNDGMFFGDNGDRTIFKEDEVVCLRCIEKGE